MTELTPGKLYAFRNDDPPSFHSNFDCSDILDLDGRIIGEVSRGEVVMYLGRLSTNYHLILYGDVKGVVYGYFDEPTAE